MLAIRWSSPKSILRPTRRIRSQPGWSFAASKNVVERAAILSDDETIGVDHILFSHEIGRSVQDQKNASLLDLAGAGSLKNLVARYEKDIIIDSLKKSSTIRKTAREMGMSHTALLNKMKKYKITMAK